MGKPVDLCKINVTNSGTGALTLGTAAEGFRGREVLSNGVVYSYAIQQDSTWEFGRGTYLADTTQLVRSPLGSSDGGTALNLKPNAQVAFVLLAEDLDALQLSADAVAAAAQTALDRAATHADKLSIETTAAQTLAASLAAGQFQSWASRTTPPAGVASGSTYWVVASDGLSLILYLNASGTGSPDPSGAEIAEGPLLRNLLDQFTTTTTTTVGTPNTPVAGTVSSSGTWFIDAPFPHDGTLASVTFNAPATGTFILKLATLTGSYTATQQGADISITVSATGLHTYVAGTDFGAGIAVTAGWIWGVYAPGILTHHAPAVTGDAGWIYAGGNQTTASSGSLSNSVGFEIQVATSYRTPRTIDDVIASAIVQAGAGGGSRKGGRFTYDYNHLIGYGQSNMGGNGGTAVTTAQEFDLVCVGGQDPSPTALLPATVANSQIGTFSESPILGVGKMLKQRALDKLGVADTDFTWLLILANDGYTGYSITQLNKGTAPYAQVLSQVTAIKAIADAAGKTFGVPAIYWVQGEADTGLTGAAYKADLLQLESDLRTDIMAITGQTVAPPLVCWQLSSRSRQVALATLQASHEREGIIVAAPAYQYGPGGYADGVHLATLDRKINGGYLAIATFDTIMTGVKFRPLEPVSVSVLGNRITLTFNKPGLVIDTTQVPDQTFGSVVKGFSVVNGSSVAQTISAVTVSDNRVFLDMAAAPAPGWTISYAKGWTGSYPFYDANDGGAGNLRDNSGAELTFEGFAMHHWCVAFDLAL